MELALVLFFIAKQISFSKNKDLRRNPTLDHYSTTKSAPATDDEALKKARKRYEEEMMAFQDLMNYNANVAYGIEPMEEFKE